MAILGGNCDIKYFPSNVTKYIFCNAIAWPQCEVSYFGTIAIDDTYTDDIPFLRQCRLLLTI